jgi:hypothetical protein
VVRRDAAVNRMEDLNAKAFEKAVTCDLVCSWCNAHVTAAGDPKTKKSETGSKQARVIAMQ